MRPPDEIINTTGKLYIRRWWLIKWSWICVYLHSQHRDDWARDLHDHVAWNISIILRGGYYEITEEHPNGRFRWPGMIVFRRATLLHRLELAVPGRPSWSIWIRGPKMRRWGFMTKDGWMNDDDYREKFGS